MNSAARLCRLAACFRALGPRAGPPHGARGTSALLGPLGGFAVKSYSTQQLQYSDSEPVAEPTMVPWDKDKVNLVYLTGRLGQDVELRQLPNGGVVARTRLAVRRLVRPGQPDTEPDWFNVEGWDEVAVSMEQHLRKGAAVRVTGRVAFESFTGRDNVPRTVAKVRVKEFHHVEPVARSPAAEESDGATWMPAAAAAISGGSGDGGSFAERAAKRRAEWDSFFEKPEEWWDNRDNKKNAKAPDFKHKTSRDALWIESKLNPPGLVERIKEMDEGDYDGSDSPPF